MRAAKNKNIHPALIKGHQVLFEGEFDERIILSPPFFDDRNKKRRRPHEQASPRGV